ncbi:MAG: hypothetical protein GY847_14765 [Proteobacteria bacterium]|nr:hypothetical protein [Pseudomonadota bacterium]
MDKKNEKDEQDIVLLHGPTEDGEGVRGLRARPGRLDLTELRPVDQGREVGPAEEVVRLRPHEKAPFVCDVDVINEPQIDQAPKSSRDRSGPPSVATKAYRKNWDRVFRVSRNKIPKNPLLN